VKLSRNNHLTEEETLTRLGQPHDAAEWMQGSYLVVNGPDGVHLDVLDLLHGDTITFRRTFSPRRVTSEMIESLKQARLAQARGRGPEADGWMRQIETEFQTFLVPDHLPAVQALISRLPTELWVQHYQAPTNSIVTWSVFSGSGVLEKDDLDRESVRMYRRPQPRSFQ
jgi:hypothetical protein